LPNKSRRIEAINMTEFDVTNVLLERTAQAKSPEAPLARPNYEILVVDDEACMRGLLRIGMHQQGFVVWLAANGREAIDVYRRHQETIDVILLDVCMPGLDGPQTLAALQNLNPEVRCCFMSGYLGNYTEERLLALGAVAVILKPFHLAKVAQELWDQASHDRRATFRSLRREAPATGMEDGTVAATASKQSRREQQP
jgi:CheY-like chemotaxis protein